MPLTFAEVRSLVAPYAGRAGKQAEHPDVAKFARSVMEYMLLSGSHASVRRLSIVALHGVIVLPPEVEIPLKVRIDGRAADVRDKWFSFHSGAHDMDQCDSAAGALAEDGAYTPLAYDLPQGNNWVIGAISVCKEMPDAFIIIGGKDQTGRVVYLPFEGEQIAGEKLHLTNSQIQYGKVNFGEITSIIKSKTNGYVALYAVNPATDERHFLADYAPSEEKPLYRRMRVMLSCAECALISVLCRVRLKDSYYDNDLTLFDNTIAITLAAQRIQAEGNNNAEQANYKKLALKETLDDEAGYKKISGKPVDVFYPMSGGSIRSLVGRRGRGY